ncbi:MAG: GDSL-type esterase/lipase family protein [Desulfobulbaceae bacterium]|nr:GDSL-type esterase/lipase family protein [Desulfobulbaceae bacterium]
MEKTETILLLGDSLVEFFDWQARFPEMAMINRGMAGERVRGLLERIAGELAAADGVDAVVIMTGANNLAGEDYAFLRDYEEILRRVRERLPGARIVVSSLLPFRFPWLAAGAISRLNASLRAIAGLAGADYLDVHAAFVAAQRAGKICFQPDGVHLTGSGYETWARLLAGYLAG